MHRRQFLVHGVSLAGLLGMAGCRGRQVAHVLSSEQDDLVGSHTAGAATYSPLIDEAVARLLGQYATSISQVSHTDGPVCLDHRSVCFVGVENKSIEEIGDFKEQIYQQIDTQLVESQAFQPISKRYVDAGLRETRLRPDSLFIPSNMRLFSAAMEKMGQPIDYLLYATITSGTTTSNSSYQRDYLLTLEMVDVNTGESKKESAKLRKGYHKTHLSKLSHYSPFK